jgi:hypothetical protein
MFWRASYNNDDVAIYSRFLEILRLSRSGLNGEEIGRILSIHNVRKFLLGEKKSFLTHVRAELDRLGCPEPGFRWLPVQLKPRGTPGDEWVQVPSRISKLEDLSKVIDQRKISEDATEGMNEFGYKTRKELIPERVLLFGFLVGASIGDAGKHTKGESRFPSKALSLVLSTRKSNSYRFGEFTTLCARASLGLDMHRIANSPPSKHRFTDAECFRWISPASPLVGWLFHGCLGLEKGEMTTYNPLRMEWLIDAPSPFKVSVFQGISESDGWVDAGDDTVCIVSSPNTPFFSAVLSTLGIIHRVDHQESVEIIRIPTEEAARLPIFSPRIRSVYFDRMNIMSRATSLPERIKVPGEIVHAIREIAARTSVLSEICLELAKTRGVKVTSQTVRKYIGQHGR